MAGRLLTEPQNPCGYSSQTSGKQHLKKESRKTPQQWEHKTFASSSPQVSSAFVNRPRGKYRGNRETGGKPSTAGKGNEGRNSTSMRRPNKDLDDIQFIEKELLLSNERKKSGSISLNHLLNFTLTPRERHRGIDYNDYSDHYTQNKKGKKYHNFNKEQFLQANCQFVVRKDKGDYSVHCIDPDLLVDWDCIEQVILSCHDVPFCPICLYPPSSAKITRCGHVYCFSCILHYLSLSDKEWRKCPICYESVYKKHLKSVTAVPAKIFDDGDIITMRLMKRYKNGTLVLPKSDWTPEQSNQLISMEDEGHNQYAKLLSATPAQIRTKIIDTERASLKEQLSGLTPDDESERCFIELALQDLKEREDNVKQIETLQDSEVSEVINTCYKSYHDSYTSSDFEPPFSDSEDPLTTTTETDESLIDVSQQNTSSGNSEEDDSNNSSYGRRNSFSSEFVYFYQSADGQHIYLHPINTKCILKEYGTWEHCPDTVTAQIIESEHYSMSGDERSRHRFLSHLPLTCQYTLCELDIKVPLVSNQTLELFAEQLGKRKNKRQRKKREEKRREKKLERHSPLSVELPSNPQDMNPEHLHNLLSMASSPPLPSPLKPVNLSSAATVAVANDSSTPIKSSSNGVPSFAQALLSGEKKKLPLSQPPPTTGSDAKRTSLVTLHKDTMEDEDDENYYTVPSFKDAFTNGFTDALLTASIKAACATTQRQEGKPGASKTAKKGRKKLVLFSTGGQHRL